MEQFPVFSTRRVHRHYVDCAAFVGDCILSKSNDERLVLWRPGSAAPTVDRGGLPGGGGATPDLSSAKDNYWALREYKLDDGDLIWFLRFGLDAAAEVVAVGTIRGTVELFAVDGGGDDGTGGACNAKAYETLDARGCENVVRQCAFSPDRSTLVAVTDTSTLFRWNEVPAGGGVRKRKGKGKAITA
ncbi:hypothetical protein BU14_0058s0044 [Porphyra umbilicalis]|uniref:Anaphase-promoting complex subunit 4 WD40 domain-containing protein n=1 Tax=Porphyra umbilicalis TaxID=2786 RepID=A0A1X6PHJ5_PORUM|nr:hypothetical protein BU14_0058s0044 [Porphyra umbilicalis]|eukprot:OSX80133.1 hypothetical protein BU14_0058s0044 [Porphyra umbilicalis]